jgi:hypothetical protein
MAVLFVIKRDFSVGRRQFFGQRFMFVGLVAVCLFCLDLGGCQVFAKLDDRIVDPPPPRECALPTVGDAQIRIANFFPADTNVDFCVKRAGAASYSHPVLRNAGMDESCSGGLAYRKMTLAFSVQSGAIDVRVVPPGAGGCNQAPLAEMAGIDVPAGAVTQLLHAGGNNEPARIVVLREGTAGSNLKIRFVNLVGGIGPMNFGLTAAPTVPTTLSVPITRDAIPFGGTLPPLAKAATGTIDEFSFLGVQSAGLSFGASRAGDKNAVVAIGSGRVNGNFDLYAVGNPKDIRFPPRALMCGEGPVSSLVASGAGPVSPLFATCMESDLPSISIEVYGAGLYGLYAKRADERKPFLVREIAKNDSDILCLTDVWRREDKQLFKDEIAKTGRFPYIATFETNRDTPITDPRDQQGNVPLVPPTTASCGSSAPLANALISCLSNKCTTSKIAGDEAGGLISGDCLSSECLTELVPLATGDMQQQDCFNCIVFDGLAYNSFGEIKTDCFNPAGRGGYFGGQNGNMILSKFPISKVEGYVLPTTGQKRVIVSASIEYEAKKSIDVHCGVLDSILDAPFNYNGPYSKSRDKQGFQDEQVLQAVRTSEWVKKRSGTKRAVIAVGMGASAADPKTGILDLNPLTPATFLKSFKSAEANGWQSKCTVCGAENSLCDASQNYWEHRIFLHNIDVPAVVSTERRYTDAIVTIPNNAEKVPMSENFSYRIKLLRQ